MAIATFVDVNTQKFTLNGAELFKFYNVLRLSDTSVRIVNVYDNDQQLYRSINVSDVEVDGVTYTNANDLITNLAPVIYVAFSSGDINQAQLDANTAAINNLPNLYAPLNHSHPDLYLLQSEIEDLIDQQAGGGSDIDNAIVQGSNIVFRDSSLNTLFTVDASAFRRQGNNITFDESTGVLQLTNVFGQILSSITIKSTDRGYRELTYIEGIENDLSNLNVDDDFYLAKLLNGNLAFVYKKGINFDIKNFRLFVFDFSIDVNLVDPDINDTVKRSFNFTDPNPLVARTEGNYLFDFRRNDYGDAATADMVKTVYDPQLIENDAFDRANHTGQEQTEDIANNAVTNVKLANMNANTFKGRLSGNGQAQDVPLSDAPISTATQNALDAINASIGSIGSSNGGPESFVRTTTSQDQTLNDGTFTILDYDNTIINNDTSNYTVGNDGRITILKDGIYNISAGVVLRSGLLTAAESTGLGLFVNGEIVSFESTTNILIADAERAHTTSTQITLLENDIVDVRAFIESAAGGALDFIAVLIPVIFGNTATQINNLAISRCSDGSVQADLAETDTTSASFVLNKDTTLFVTVTTNLNTSELIGGIPQNGKRVVIDNGTNNVTVTIDSDITDIGYEKTGAGSVTFVADTGQTLDAYNSVAELTNTFDFAFLGSISSTNHRLRINTLQ